MKVVWSSEDGRPPRIVSGKHKPGRPRMWTVSISFGNDKAEESYTLRPEGKILVTELDSIIAEVFDTFTKQYGTITKARWTAIAR